MPEIAPPPSRTWPDEFTLSSLQLLADGITRLVGFGVAVISLADDDGCLHMAVASGSAEARAELSGTRTPIELLYSELEKADDWGRFKFVPHDRLDGHSDAWGWVPDLAPGEGEDAWHPLDLLIAPLYDTTGELCGTLAIDMPDDGRRPGPEQRGMLDQYAELTARGVISAVERRRLSQRVRLADDTRALIRKASRELSLETLVSRVSDDLVRCFRLEALWARIFAGEDARGWVAHASAGSAVAGEPRLGLIAERQARRLWEQQAIGIVYLDESLNVPDDEDAREVRELSASKGFGAVAWVPLGAGTEVLGALTLVRAADAPRWTEPEMTAALDIGRDLGQMMLNARAFEREQQKVRELRHLDSYKSELIATVSHELKNPLTALLSNLEIVEEVSPPEDPTAARALLNVDRSAQRMVRVVEDLLLLSRVADPETPLNARPVDLLPVVREVCELTEAAASQRDLSVHVRASPLEPMVAFGDAPELDRVVVNLVSNAVKYTPDGGAITITLRRSGDEIELVVADEGIGIAAEDQEQLFREFFRSSDPRAQQQPGTGLGLAIVDRIVRRHGGRIEVESELGRGSTFRVFLPAC